MHTPAAGPADFSVGLIDEGKKVLDSSNPHIKAAIKAAFKGDVVPEYAQEGYHGILKLLSPMTEMEPKQQLKHIAAVFNDPRREGWDCDANGTWQPLFLDTLHRSIAKEHGLSEKLIGAGIERSQPPKNRWRMRQYLDGD